MEEPFVSIGMFYTKAYFGFFLIYPMVMRVWWRMLRSIGPEGFDMDTFFSWFRSTIIG